MSRWMMAAPTAALMLAVAVAGASRSAADDGPRNPQPTASTVGTAGSVDVQGKVTRIVDGDTIMVDIWGDGTTTPVAVRNNGIQAMEVGQCHASTATAVLAKALPVGSTVRLTAQSSSSSSLGRPVRYVDRVVSTGNTDSQLAVLRAGQALWLMIQPENARALSYHVAMETAAAQRIGIFDNDACGSGPSQSAALRVWVHYDGDGDESLNPNTEWVEVLNPTASDVKLGGWWIRTGGPDNFVLPSTAVVPAKKTLRLYVGKGTNSTTRFYWGSSAPKFRNLTATDRQGSGAYLFDPQGDLRAHATYPCVVGSCSDPLAGKIRLTANYDAPGDDMTNPNGEYVMITSLVDGSLDLSYRVVQVLGSTYQLGGGTVLPAKGSSVRVYVGKGTSTTSSKYWGKTGSIMVNGGGSAELRTSEAVRIACTSWGTGRC